MVRTPAGETHMINIKDYLNMKDIEKITESGTMKFIYPRTAAAVDTVQFSTSRTRHARLKLGDFWVVGLDNGAVEVGRRDRRVQARLPAQAPQLGQPPVHPAHHSP